jgi:MYXO-CTERM domain-containing protein
VTDLDDNCHLVNNPEQLDTDADGTGDACEDDKDGDTVADVDDNCPLVANLEQADTDADGSGDICDGDDDDDTVGDDADNCPMDANSDQLDTDGDGLGDMCDDDTDGDEVVDADDVCPMVAARTADGCPEELAEELEPGVVEGGGGCGCSSTGGPSSVPSALLFVIGFAALRLRRRRS